MPRLLFELKRRRVYRVAAVYVVAAWAVVQVAATVQPFLGLPAAFVTGVIVIAALGFPLAVGLAWAFDLTPEGIRRTPEAESSPSAEARPAGRPMALVATLLVLVLAGSLALTALRRHWWPDASAAASPETAILGATAPRSGDRGSAALASIAVLPFHNLSAERSNEYFSDGITDEILTNLARLAGVKVISHTSVMQYRNTVKPLRQIGQELGVATVLEGSVQQVGGRVRIEAQLIDARTDRHLWAERYDRDLKDVFAVESDVAEKIATALKARLTPEEHDRMAVRPTQSAEAHRLYLQGLSLWYRQTESDLRRAGERFQKAIDLDPTFALAYAGLANVHSDLARFGDQAANIALARMLARRALTLDSTLAEPHDALGFIAATMDFDLATGEREVRRAIALKPGLPIAHYDLGTVLLYQGRVEEALLERQKAAELDPAMDWAALGPIEVLDRMGRYAEALRAARRVAAAMPDRYRAHGTLATAYRRVGRLEQAAAEYREAIRLEPGAPWFAALLGITELGLGRRPEAERIYLDLQSRDAGSKVARASLAGVLGRRDEAFALLERAYADRAEDLLTLGYDPDFEPLRGDPRFEALRKKVGFR